MRQWLKQYSLGFSVLLAASLVGCSKKENPGPGGGNSSGGTGTNTDTTCKLASISQVNSGTSVESSLSVTYNSSHDVTKIVVYDSLSKTKSFEASFTYITADSVRIDPFQYLLLDGQKRVIRFVTKSDLADPLRSDNYVFVYQYNSDGYLASKNLFINGTAKVNLSTVYTYTNGTLTSCSIMAPNAGNGRVMLAALSYDNSTIVKNWINTFPDAIEGYPYLAVLNFGKRPVHPLTRVVTQIYNPATGSLVDTWTTNYGNYKIDTKGYVLSGVATGDLQQGMAAFYGKTNFYYTCY
jgi:hypothetical protein